MGARMHKNHLTAIAFLLFFFTQSYGQQVAVRNNLLYDATLTPNLGMEVRLDSTWAVGLNAGLNAWDIDKEKNKKWRHFLVSPFVRHYITPRRQCQGDSLRHSWFWGIHAVYSHYNVGGVTFPLGLYSDVKDSRRQGDLVALGGSFGRYWRLTSRLAIEAEIGLALGYTWYEEYECPTCGPYLGKDNKPFLLPKLGFSLVWTFGKKEASETKQPIVNN